MIRVRWEDFSSQHSPTLTLIIRKCRKYVIVSAWGRIKQLPDGHRAFFSFPIHKDICAFWFFAISLIIMCCSKLYIWGILSVKSSLCILTLSAFEQYPHNLPSGRSTHQGSALPRNWTTASRDGLPGGQSPAWKYERKRNCRTGCYHRKKRKIFTNHSTARAIPSLTYRVAVLLTLLEWNAT